MLTHGQRVVETLTKDISLSGLRCLSPIAIPPSTPVHVELILGAGEPILNLNATAIWSKAIPKSEQFYLGLSFPSIDDEHMQRLSASVHSMIDKTIQKPSEVTL